MPHDFCDTDAALLLTAGTKPRNTETARNTETPAERRYSQEHHRNIWTPGTPGHQNF